MLQKINSFRDNQIEKAIATRTKSLEDKATYLIRLISHNGSLAISEYNFSFLNNVIAEAVSKDDDLLGCRILANNFRNSLVGGIGVGDSDLLDIIVTAWKEHKDLLTFPADFEPSQTLPVVMLEMEYSPGSNRYVLLFVAPIYVGNRLWGTANAIFSRQGLEHDTHKIENDWLQQIRHYKLSLIAFALLFSILGGLITYFFTRPLIRSLQLLGDGVNRIAGGNLEHHIDEDLLPIVEVHSLSRSFNLMTDNLRWSRQQLDAYSHSLEEKVEERTRELQEAQRELVNQAHEAGMAEMAVGVLHNIGNAITPAKVNASLLLKKLSKSPLRNELRPTLLPLARMLENPATMNRDSLTKLQTIISLLPASIEEEYNDSIKALEAIVTKHDYIEGVIGLQMRYAKVSGASGAVEVKRVLEDALKLMAELITKHEITVTTEIKEVPAVLIEENKLLQIMVNIIKNGCEAMEATPVDQRVLAITAHEEQSGVIITVADTGCGFSDEVRDKLFGFGYSTKERSSGFGLHSSANFLIANNGSIEARSDGPGKGAEFRIRLQSLESQQRVQRHGKL